MVKGKKLNISKHSDAAVIVSRASLKAEKLVYIATANKTLRYPHAKSRIVYIGTTKKGVGRIAASAADKAQALLLHHGIKSLSFYVVTCRPRQNVETWKKLERGLIIAFKHLFGTPPKANTQGVNMKWGDTLSYFTRHALEATLAKYS